MRQNGQPEPVFANERGEFKVILYRSAVAEYDDGENLLEFCKIPRTRQEIANFLGLASVSYAIKTYVQPLIDAGLIKMSNPNSPQSRNQLYETK